MTEVQRKKHSKGGEKRTWRLKRNRESVPESSVFRSNAGPDTPHEEKTEQPFVDESKRGLRRRSGNRKKRVYKIGPFGG